MKKMIGVLMVTVLTISTSPLLAQQKIMLWPQSQLPNSKGLAIQDSIRNDRIYQLKHPHMYAFHPAKEESVGAAVLVIPGGGYNHVTYDLSGFQIAKWFNTLGIHAFVLNYRIPKSPDLIQREIAPLQDAQRAMRIIRSKAKMWNIDPHKIGAMGTSAGGHLTATLGTFSEDYASLGDYLDTISFTPDFMMMVSPVITFGEHAHEGSKFNLLGEDPSAELVQRFSAELRVSSNAPPAFLVHAANDKSVHPMNSILFYEALLEHKKLESSLHIFPQGGHGIGIMGNPGSTKMWTDLAEEWLLESGFIQAPR